MSTLACLGRFLREWVSWKGAALGTMFVIWGCFVWVSHMPLWVAEGLLLLQATLVLALTAAS